MRFDPQTLIWLALLIPSITFHEFMHGFAAHKLGDPTAKNAGRLTLNPLPHIDPIGSIVLPLILTLTGGPVFGYAKPVPINPSNFKNIRTGDLITGIAGPASNFLLALIGAILAWVALPLLTVAEQVAGMVYLVGSGLAYVNLVLMFFNLIPLPPLDGSSIVPIFLSDRQLHSWYRFQQYSFAILLALLWLVPSVTGFDPIGVYFDVTVEPLANLLLP